MTAPLFLSKAISNAEKTANNEKLAAVLEERLFFLLYPNPKYFKPVLSIAINQYDDMMSL